MAVLSQAANSSGLASAEMEHRPVLRAEAFANGGRSHRQTCRGASILSCSTRTMTTPSDSAR